jgi:hypothetical protein
MENECKYVCSRGILKSCDIFSARPISSIRQLIGYDFSKCNDAKCKEAHGSEAHGSETKGQTLYICSSALPQFINVLFPIFPYKIILVTGDCDETCWTDLFDSYEAFKTFIDNDKIIHWFSQNCIMSHKKLTRIPIGLDYHTMTNGPTKWGPALKPVDQETILNNIQRVPFWERTYKCYSNFHFFTTTKYGYDRVDAIKEIPSKLVYYEPTHIIRETSWTKQSKYAFVISPHGGGLDCHRLWEALVLGCIPIVKASGIDALYNDLPVLIVKDWSDITKKLLRETIVNFKTKVFNYDKLLLSYWMNLIRSKSLTTSASASTFASTTTFANAPKDNSPKETGK